MPENKESSPSTDTWQPGYIREHHARQSQYLETVAATGLMQAVAANSLALLSLASGAQVLEVGCGNGAFLPSLAKAVGASGRVVGLDHSPEFVSEAAQRMAAAGLNNVVTQLGDAYALPFEDGTFDAAHCERVLMHLDDPTAALREMARVVRAGGVVVAAEPDWAGVRIDHVDRPAFELVYARALRQRQRDLGITLRRRMREAGLTGLMHLPAPFAFDRVDTLRAYGLDLGSAVDQLIAEGAMPSDRLRAVEPALEAASAADQYYATGFMHVVAGRVP